MSERRVKRHSVPCGPSKQVMYNAAGIIGMFTLLVFLWYALPVLLLIFLSILVAIPLYNLTELTERYTKLDQVWAFSLVITFLVAVFLTLAYFFGYAISEQAVQLADRLPQALHTLQDRIAGSSLGRFFGGKPTFDVIGHSYSIINRATGVVSSTVSAIFMGAMVLFIGAYIAVNPTIYTNGALRLIPLDRRDYAAEVMGTVGKTLRKWLSGQLIAMAAVGLMTTIGLYFLGVPYAIGLGFIAFILDFVPNFGPILAAAPAVILTLAEDPSKAMYVVLLYFVVQQIEGVLIAPLVHQKTVRLPPALTIVAQVLLGILAGPLGLLLATPLTAVTIVLVKMLYVRDTLGDRIPDPARTLKEKDKPPVPEGRPARA